MSTGSKASHCTTGGIFSFIHSKSASLLTVIAYVGDVVPMVYNNDLNKCVTCSGISPYSSTNTTNALISSGGYLPAIYCRNLGSEWNLATGGELGTMPAGWASGVGAAQLWSSQEINNLEARSVASSGLQVDSSKANAYKPGCIKTVPQS